MVEDCRTGLAGDAWSATPPAHRIPLFVLAVAAAALTFLTMRAEFAAVWHTGAFLDTDDAMHLVQARALLAGQGWFDMTVPNLNPPAGTVMHWSRLVDVPVAALMKLAALAGHGPTAERLTRLAVPFCWLVALYLAMARLAGQLLGPEGRLPALAATALSGGGVIEFLPGRIDHHGPQIVVLVVMLGAVMAAVRDPHRARQAAWAGGLAGVSLAINLEDLPFIVAIGGGLLTQWVWQGDPAHRPLGWFAAGLAIGLPVSFVATVAPSLYLAPVCDAYGAAHLGAGTIGAAGCAGAAWATRRLRTRTRRALAALAIAGAAVAYVRLAYPACLHDPFAAVDPLVRELWLSHVQESLPFTALLRQDPAAALFAVVPVALGLVGCCLAACVAPHPQRAGFALVAAVVGVGLGLSFWQVRVFSSITALALCGGLYVACSARRVWRDAGRETLAGLSLALLFPFTATAVGLVVPADATPVAQPADSRLTTMGQCLAPDAFAPLAGLTGRAVAPIDAGSFLLVHTRLSVFAAAFHRDNDGNRFHFEMMMAPADIAGRMAARRYVDLVLTCPGLSETRDLATRAPAGLAADLIAGRIPGWLVPVALPDTPYRVYRVVPASLDPASRADPSGGPG